MRTTMFLVASLAAAAGCMKTSATYCAKHGAMDPEHCPPTDAVDTSCTTNDDCAGSPSTPVCNTTTAMCVECLDATTCGGAEPVCGTDNACRGCVAHTECASELCLPDGSCAIETEVAYVAGLPAPGSSSDCTKASPCDKIQKGLAVDRPYIKLTGAVNEVVDINDRDVALIGAPGARIANSSNDTTNLLVRGSSDVAVHHVQIGDGVGRTFGVRLDAATGSLLLDHVRVSDNFNGGIFAVRGRLSVWRSTIRDNNKGGIEVEQTAGPFDIRNNFIYFNGTNSGVNASLFGGVLIEADAAGRVEFNTIAFNNGNGFQNRSGLACYGPTNSANGNLVYGNRDALVTDNTTQIGGNCPVGTSYAAGSGDLGFANPSVSTPDFHLTVLSPPTVLDAGGACEATNAVDVDDQPRAYGAACDVGADELTPP